MLQFIDCNCMIGKRLNPREGAMENLEEYLEVMDRCDIVQSIAYHSVSREQNYRRGNILLEEELAGNSRFMKQWIVVPNHSGEYMDTEELLEAMKEHDVKTVRVCPKAYGFSLRPYDAGELLQTMSDCKIPVFIESSQTDWDGLYQMLTDYPQLKVVFCDVGYDQMRHMYALLDSCPNLYVETSTYIVNDGIREFVRRYGSDRMLFGTGLPDACATGAVTLLRYMEIAEEDKEKIAKGNILKLLEEVVL